MQAVFGLRAARPQLVANHVGKPDVEEIPRGENHKLQREQLQAMLKSIVEED